MCFCCCCCCCLYFYSLIGRCMDGRGEDFFNIFFREIIFLLPVLQTSHFHGVIFLQVRVIFNIAVIVIILIRSSVCDYSLAAATTAAAGDRTRVGPSLNDQHLPDVQATVRHLLSTLTHVVCKHTVSSTHLVEQQTEKPEPVFAGYIQAAV